MHVHVIVFRALIGASIFISTVVLGTVIMVTNVTSKTIGLFIVIVIVIIIVIVIVIVIVILLLYN